MSEVWKSCTYSSQMRLLGETPYICIFSQSGVTDFRAEHSISGIVRALSYKTTTQAVKSSKMLFNPQSPVKFVPQKVLSPIQIWVGVLGKIVGWWLRGHWGAGSNDGLTDWMAEDNEAAETETWEPVAISRGSRCLAGYFGSTECIEML